MRKQVINAPKTFMHKTDPAEPFQRAIVNGDGATVELESKFVTSSGFRLKTAAEAVALRELCAEIAVELEQRVCVAARNARETIADILNPPTHPTT